MPIRTATLLWMGLAAMALLATDRVLLHVQEGQIRALEKEQAAIRARARHIREETKQLQAKRQELDLSVDEMSAEMKRLSQTRPPLPRTTSSTKASTVSIKQSSAKVFPRNVVVRASPFCQERVVSPSKLPKFIFVAGVEGSGHHALKDVWHSLQEAGHKLEIVVYDQIFHSLGIENHASYHYSSILQETYLEHMRPVFEKAAAEGKVVIDAQNSYPMGKGAGPLAHPDLLKLVALDGVLFDLRIIVLFRPPVDAVLSAVRRFQDDDEYLYKNEEFQARMITESLATINNALPHLPCDRYMMIEYETLVHHPARFIEPLAQLLDVAAPALSGAFSNLKPRVKPPEAPEKVAKRQKLKAFFDIQKILWPLLEQQQ